MGVMGTKLGTKAFGQTQSSPISDSSIDRTMSAGQMKKLGSDDIGDVLNKVADPNWIDPSKKMRTVGNDKLDKDAFFKLMLTQMKNQDPTNPMKSHEMAAQLASFTSLEQMQNMNKTLTEISEAQKPTQQFQVLQFLGKSVAGDSSKIFRSKGDKDHDLLFDLPMDAKETVIQIKNSEGDLVRSYKLNNLKQGENRISWNGLDEKGNPLPAGDYKFDVEAKNEQDKKIAIKTDFQGLITGVNYTKEGPILLVGNQAVRLRDVKKIIDGNLVEKNKKNNPAGNLPPQGMNSTATATATATETKPQSQSVPTTSAQPTSNEDIPGAPEAPEKSKLFDQVGLSSEMMSKLAKETE